MSETPPIEIIKKLPLITPERFESGGSGSPVDRAVQLLNKVVLDADILFDDSTKEVIDSLKYNVLLKKLCSKVEGTFCKYPDAYALILFKVRTKTGRLVTERKLVAGASKPLSVVLTSESICLSRGQDYFFYVGSDVEFLRERVKQGKRFTTFLVDCIPVAYSPRSGARIYRRYIPFRMFLVDYDDVPAIMIVVPRTLVKRIFKVLVNHGVEVRIGGKPLETGDADDILRKMKEAHRNSYYSRSAGFGDLGRIEKRDFLPGLNLRDYQIAAVNSALDNLELTGGSVIMAPTGSGKTEMAVALAGHLLQKKAIDKVIFTAFSKDLAIQARDRFVKYGISAELIDNASQIGRLKYAKASTITAQSFISVLTAYTVRKSLEALFGMNIDEIIAKYGHTFIDLLRNEEARDKALKVVFPATISASYPFYGSIYAAERTTETNIGGTAKLLALVESIYESYREDITRANREREGPPITPNRIFADLITLGILSLDVLMYMKRNERRKLEEAVNEIYQILRDYNIKVIDREINREETVNLMVKLLNDLEAKLRNIRSKSTAGQVLKEIREMFGDIIYMTVSRTLMVPALVVSALSGVTVDPVKLADCLLDKTKCGKIMMSLVMLEKVKELSNEVIESLEGKKVMIIIDEVHHAAASTMMALVSVLPRTLRLGLSATPWRTDGLDIAIYETAGDLTDYRINYSELIKRGYLSKILVKFELAGSTEEASLWYNAAMPYYLMVYNMLKYAKKSEAGPSDRTKYKVTRSLIREIESKAVNRGSLNEIMRTVQALERLGRTFAPEDITDKLLDAVKKGKISEITTPEAFIRTPADVGAVLGTYTPQWIKNVLVWEGVWRFLKYTKRPIDLGLLNYVIEANSRDVEKALSIGKNSSLIIDAVNKAAEGREADYDPLKDVYSRYSGKVEELVKEFAEEHSGGSRKPTVYDLAKHTFLTLKRLKDSSDYKALLELRMLLTATTANMLGLSQIEATGFTNAVTLLAATSPITVEWLVSKLKELISSGTYPIIVMHDMKEPLKFLFEELRKRASELGVDSSEIELIVGDITPLQRKEILEKTRKNKLKIVLAISRIADEGLDIPSLRAIIDLYANASVTKLPQRIGRLTRPYPGKEYGIYIVASMNPFPLGQPLVKLTERKYDIVKVYQEMLSEAFENGEEGMMVSILDLCEKAGVVTEECEVEMGKSNTEKACEEKLTVKSVLNLPEPTPLSVRKTCTIHTKRGTDTRDYLFNLVYSMADFSFSYSDGYGDQTVVEMSVPLIWIGVGQYLGWPFGRISEKTFQRDLITWGKYNAMINDQLRQALYEFLSSGGRIALDRQAKISEMYVKSVAMSQFASQVLNHLNPTNIANVKNVLEFQFKETKSTLENLRSLTDYYERSKDPLIGIVLELADVYGVLKERSMPSAATSSFISTLEMIYDEMYDARLRELQLIPREDIDLAIGPGIWATPEGPLSPCGVAVVERYDNLKKYLERLEQASRELRRLSELVCNLGEDSKDQRRRRD